MAPTARARRWVTALADTSAMAKDRVDSLLSFMGCLIFLKVPVYDHPPFLVGHFGQVGQRHGAGRHAAINPLAVTLEILLEGRVFDAVEAERKGLLTRVVPAAAMHDEVTATVQRLSAGAPLAARINKTTIRRLSPDPTLLTDAEFDAHFRYATSRDHAEGVAAFLAHRPPDFTGE